MKVVWFNGQEFLVAFLLGLAVNQLGVHGGTVRRGDNGENEVLKPEPETEDRNVSAVAPNILEAYYYQQFGDLTNSETGQFGRLGNATPNHSCNSVREVPQELRSLRLMRPRGIRAFYQKYTEAYGIPVLGSAEVDDAALSRACYVLRFLLADRADLRQRYYKEYGRVAVLSPTEHIKDLPEYNVLNLPEEFNVATRGLGAIPIAPVSSGAEENVRCFRNDSYSREDILIREIAEGIFHLAAKREIPGIAAELEALYQGAIGSGWWQNTYASLSAAAYFGEGVQSYFSVNGYSNQPDGMHNQVNTRIKLGEYDPELLRFVERFFPCSNSYLKRCRSKGNEHLQALTMNCHHMRSARRRSHVRRLSRN